MAEPIEIEVVTDTNGRLVPELNASVSIVTRDKVGNATWPFEALPFTHTHFQNGFYRALSGDPADEPGPGEWLLVVSLPGKSPVVQRLTLSERGGVLVAAAGWGVPASKQNEHTALTVSIVGYEQKQGAVPARPAKRSRVSVKLFPRMEMVALACLDKTGAGVKGTHFDAFAKSRTHRLFAENKLNDGVIFTLLTVTTRLTEVWVKSRSPLRQDWILLEQKLKAPPPLSTSTPAVGKDIGILDFYEHLNDVGRAAPGSVIEAGIFGHAFVLGPIVWNTFDNAPSFTARDPNDLDGRSKDWIPQGAVDTQYPLLHDAFHQQRGALRAWGCNHMNNVLAELVAAVNALNKKTPRNQFFLVKLPAGRENLTLDHLKRNVAQYVVSQKIKHTIEHGDASGVAAYCGAAAQKLLIPAFGAPPGMGSNFGGSDKQDTLIMHIVASPKTENEIPMKYYEREFGSFFVRDDLNYLNYTAMLPAPLPDPGWATQRFIVYFDDDLEQQILRLPSGLEVYRKAHAAYSDPIAWTDLGSGVTGHLYVAPGAKVDHVEDRDADRVLMLAPATGEDTGVFVGKDGRSILFRRTVGQPSFTTNTGTVRVYRMTFDGGLRWSFSQNAPTTLSNGILQTVMPKWYW